MKFYICRHGQTSFNVQGKIQGHSNLSVLTDLGKKQVLSVGHKLQDKNIDILISSPLVRAIESAEICKSIINKDIIIDNDFIEINVGDVEGMCKIAVSSQYKEIYEKWKALDDKNLNVCFPNGETKRQARKRFFSGLMKYTEKGYNNITIVTHGIALEQILLELGVEFSAIPNAAMICIEYKDDKFSFDGFI